MELSLTNILNKKTLYLIGLFVVLEALSFLAYYFPPLNLYIFSILVLGALALAIYRLEYGLLILVAELILSSKGYLFSAGGQSYRLAIFLIIILAFIIKLWRPTDFFSKLKTFKISYYFLALFLLVAIGLAQGLSRYGLSLFVFSDFNAWLFFALLPPLILVYYRAQEAAVYQRLAFVSLAAVIWLCLKTLLFFFIFAHDISWAPILYKWIRTSGVGEITNIGFNWPRIFLQSQVYAPLAFIFLLFLPVASKGRDKFIYFGLLVLFLMTTLISFSRSFWVGLAVAYILSAILIISRGSWRAWLKSLPGLLLTGIASLVIIYLIAFFPAPKSLVSFSTGIFSRRANFLSEEAAIASRWSLLPPLWQKVKVAPVFGQGFGTTITYKSSDPRILASNPSGQYTTYAFEWGYFDLWLKIGLLGVLAYLALLLKIIIVAGQGRTKFKLALAAGLVFLAVTNFFTPYLNHPLGIAYIMLSSCLIF